MTPRLWQLYSLRAQVEALIALEESGGVVEQPQEIAPEVCPHPEDKRKPSHNMGQEPEFFCFDCKSFVKGVA